MNSLQSALASLVGGNSILDQGIQISHHSLNDAREIAFLAPLIEKHSEVLQKKSINTDLKRVTIVHVAGGQSLQPHHIHCDIYRSVKREGVALCGKTIIPEGDDPIFITSQSLPLYVPPGNGWTSLMFS